MERPIDASSSAVFEFVRSVKDIPESLANRGEIIEAYFDHLKWRFRNLKRNTLNQKIHSWLITIVVLCLVGAGILLSYMQLKHVIDTESSSSLSTEMTVAESSLKISTTIVGAVILVISIVFFYLFLKFVYPGLNKLPEHLPLSSTDFETVIKIAEVNRIALEKKGKPLDEFLREILVDDKK